VSKVIVVTSGKGGVGKTTTSASFSSGLALRGNKTVVIDPVLPPALDGLQINLNIAGTRFEITYEVGEKGSGPVAVELNGAPLSFIRLDNPYRTGGVEVSLAKFHQGLEEKVSRLMVRLG
jgi:predicted GTPase